MKKFRSIVRKSGGDKYKEEFEALDENDAIKRLQLRNLTIISLEEIADSEFRELKLQTNFIEKHKRIILFFIITFSALGIFAYSSFLVKREKAQKAAAEKAQKEAEEKGLFEKTKAENKIESYYEFLEHYPKGKFSNQASELLEEAFFEKAKKENKINSYKAFLNRYPKGKFAEQCQELFEKNYKDGIAICVKVIMLNAAECIKICNIWSEEWSGAIEDYDSKYMNTLLARAYKKFEEKGVWVELEKAKSIAGLLMKEFIEPPPKYVDVHNKLIELYGIYSQIYSLAIAPTGSLLTFNNSVSQLQSNLMKEKNELDVMLKD